MSPGYPIFLDVTQRLIVIVGGGAVASRKAQGVIAAGAANVRAVAPAFLSDFPQKVEKIIGNFAPIHLDNAGLVFAATDSSAVNQSVVDEARRRGILANRADIDDEDPADFLTPAVLRCGAITVAVSSKGLPALSANIRDMLAGSLTDDWANLADALGRVRLTIKSSNLPIARRREIFRALSSSQAATILATEGEAGLWAWAKKSFGDFLPILPESAKSSPVDNPSGGASA